jgi:hypothetical protein
MSKSKGRSKPARVFHTHKPAQHRVQPTRASRSINWPVLLAGVRVSDRVFPDPRGRLTHTLGAKLSQQGDRHMFTRLARYIATIAFVCLLTLLLISPRHGLAQPNNAPIGWTLAYLPAAEYIKALAVYEGELYAAGGDHSQTNGRIYHYDGITWTDTNFSDMVGVPIDMIESLEVFNGRLYIGVRAAVDGVPFAQVYYFDGETFVEDFSTSGESGYSGVEALEIHNNTLYATNSSPIGEVYQRNGDGDWLTVGSAIEPGNPVRALASHDGSLYAGTGASGNQAKVWRWTGASWTLEKDLTADFALSQDGVFSLESFHGKLYAGVTGYSTTSPVFAFDGATWSISLNTPGCSSTRLSVIGDELWAGTYCQGQVYRLQGSSWSPMGATDIAGILDMAQYGPYVYAGTFDGAGIFRTTEPLIAPQEVFLHGAGSTGNPSTLFINDEAPTASTAKYKDSSGINFNSGNSWKVIGVWSADSIFSTGTLTALGDLQVWLGLKNSDDQGTRFDLRAEVYKNDMLVSAGESYCIQGITRNPSLAKEVFVPFGPYPPVEFDGAIDVLSLKILTRIGTDGTGGFCGGHSNAVGLRLYFDAITRPSLFHVGFEQE